MSNILCIDDEPSVNVVLEQALTSMGHRPVLAATLEAGMRALEQESFDLIIADEVVPGGTGVDLLEHLRAQSLDIPVIITSPYNKVDQAVQIIRHGAVDYLTKPLRAEALRLAVRNAIELDRMRRLNEDFRREINSLGGARVIVGEGPALRRVMEMIATVAPTRATVLLQGESGTGKELFARAIHEQSPRRAEPFVTVNCAALPEGLVESVMFGHERGAFTGATARTKGAFERAHGGTLLLDEISEMRFDLQSKLLRVVQEQEVERVGGSSPVRVDVRIIATTNRDLWHEVEAGRFRRDLYYRLSVVPIASPPLRERIEDIPLLVEHFVRLTAQQIGVRAPAITPETIQHLSRHPWHGNIRELSNAVERAVILCEGGVLEPRDFLLGSAQPLPDPHAGPAPAPPERPRTNGASDDDRFDLRKIERDTIRRALEATHGHRTRAAKLLGISERTLRNKLNT